MTKQMEMTIWIQKDKKMFGILCSVSFTLSLFCHVNLISLKELIIKRQEVQKHSKKAINT